MATRDELTDYNLISFLMKAWPRLQPQRYTQAAQGSPQPPPRQIVHKGKKKRTTPPIMNDALNMPRKNIPKKTEMKILTQSRRRCCLCFGLYNDTNEKQGQIAHLDKNPANNNTENLAFLCLNHHDKYDGKSSQSKGYTIQEVKEYRDHLYNHFNKQLNYTTPNQINDGDDKTVEKDFPLFVLLPIELKTALRRFQPDYRLPDDDDLDGDWLIKAKPDPQAVLYCKGKYINSKVEEYCFFALSKKKEGYKIFVLTENDIGDPYLIELRHNTDSPTRYYVKTVKPGIYPISPVIWKRGGKKTLILEKEAIEIGMFESASCIFYWDEEEHKFIEQWIVD